ncbi:MAG: alpha/beta hydrolase [Chloroflexi bacterium]|nr:alpha/beta hydrolase [Chloroflexota bacterium]
MNVQFAPDIERANNTQSAIPTERRLTIRGADVFVRQSGQGTPILYLHGSPDTHAMWLPVIERLGGGYHHIAIDLPGFGATTLPRAFPLTLENYAAFVADLLDALGITEPVILAMTDFGGHYAGAFAVTHPQRVRGMVISNTAFFRDYQWHSFAKLYRVPLLGELMLGTTPPKTMKSSIKRFAPALPDRYIEESYAAGFGSKAVRKAVLRMYRERNPEHFIGWDDKLVALLQETPALVLWGDKDPFITPAYAERWGKAQVQHFAENSHWLPLEASDAYADAVRRWAEDLS